MLGKHLRIGIVTIVTIVSTTHRLMYVLVQELSFLITRINACRKHVSIRSGVSGAKSCQKIAVSGLLSRFSLLEREMYI